MNLLRLFANLRNGLKIIFAYLFPEGRLHGSTESIIKQIHQSRFDRQNRYLTTGGHFSDLFVRNTGVFYNSLLDPRILSSNQDWKNRQQICFRTIEYILNCFNQTQKTSTTISPFTSTIFTTRNVYASPSDSLYSILYGLKMLLDDQTIPQRYPAPTKLDSANRYQLELQKETAQLLHNHKSLLAKLITDYLNLTIDQKTQLIHPNLHLSSARDGVKRCSAFYDNVISWATFSLARELNVPISISEDWNMSQKQKIIRTFWQSQKGIFKDDLFTNAFSADQLIVLTTKFLNVQYKDEQKYLSEIIHYIQSKHLDSPFPLHYSDEHHPTKLYWPVRYFAPHYMTYSIWSHWGIEYIKLLTILSGTDSRYLQSAGQHLLSYQKNIQTYGGYPECYNLQGTPLREGLYQTVLHTSWVINFEQAQMLYCQYT